MQFLAIQPGFSGESGSFEKFTPSVSFRASGRPW